MQVNYNNVYKSLNTCISLLSQVFLFFVGPEADPPQ